MEEEVEMNGIGISSRREYSENLKNH